MTKDMKTVVMDRIEDVIEKIKNNDFNIFFFVADSRNIPNSQCVYVYEMAKTLQDKGYNVTMLYQLTDEYTEAEIHKRKKQKKYIDPEKTFMGVGEWMGKEYASIPHMNVSKIQWTVGPADILFIPEVFSSLMFQTYKYNAPCRRVVILQNFDHVTDFIPVGIGWKDYGIYDVIATTKRQEKLIKGCFPYLRSKILPPMVPSIFRKPVKPKKLLINALVTDQRILNKIVKMFYWKHPEFKFVSFVDLRNLPRDVFAERLKEGALAVWVDRETAFGHRALEAMACDTYVIGAVPSTVPEWMMNEKGELGYAGAWTYDINDIPDILALAISSWMKDRIPENLINDMEATKQIFTPEKWDTNVTKVIEEIIEEQLKSLTTIKDTMNSEKAAEEQATEENNEPETETAAVEEINTSELK